MNNQGELTTEWADGEYTFRLTVSGIIELEDKCKAPIAVIASRVIAGAWSSVDIIETLRIGLIGGGTKPVDAKKLVDRYALPFADNWPVVQAILGGAMYGFEAHPLGKTEAAPEVIPSVSTPPKSSEPPSSLESVLRAWDASAFGNSLPQ